MPNKRVTAFCGVCGYEPKDPPYGPSGRDPSFDYCECCGVEFCYQEATVKAARGFRENWLRQGAEWDEPTEKPDNWQIEAQLTNIPTRIL